MASDPPLPPAAPADEFTTLLGELQKQVEGYRSQYGQMKPGLPTPAGYTPPAQPAPQGPSAATMTPYNALASLAGAGRVPQAPSNPLLAASRAPVVAPTNQSEAQKGPVSTPHGFRNLANGQWAIAPGKSSDNDEM